MIKVGLLGLIPLLLVLGGMIFFDLVHANFSERFKEDSTEEINNSLKIITKQNEEIIYLLINKNR